MDPFTIAGLKLGVAGRSPGNEDLEYGGDRWESRDARSAEFLRFGRRRQ